MIDPLFISNEQKNKIICDMFLLNAEKLKNMFRAIQIVAKANAILKSAATDELKAEAREKLKPAYENFLTSVDVYGLNLIESVLTRIDVIKDMYTQCKSKEEFNKAYIHNTIEVCRRRAKGENVEKVVSKTGEISIKEVINNLKK